LFRDQIIQHRLELLAGGFIFGSGDHTPHGRDRIHRTEDAQGSGSAFADVGIWVLQGIN
jgi:hypothetical protein